MDSRIIDLATSGLINNLLVIPRFTVKEFIQNAEGSVEPAKVKAKRALEIVKKLETMPGLNLRYNETDFPEIKDANSKFVRLARLSDSSILTADINRIEQSSLEGITIININMLANSLKPITQTGEFLTIKVQRYGKEARQGVGYLEDGTMVVINGGAEFIGETIKAQVLSVKHTSSGRMIFCNAAEEGFLSDEEMESTLANMEMSPKNYFSMVIKGIGNDIIEIDRIAKAMAKYGQKFFDRLFTEKEQAYCLKHHKSETSFCRPFCSQRGRRQGPGNRF